MFSFLEPQLHPTREFSYTNFSCLYAGIFNTFMFFQLLRNPKCTIAAYWAAYCAMQALTLEDPMVWDEAWFRLIAGGIVTCTPCDGGTTIGGVVEFDT
jgi:hypothetical protein